MLLVRRITLLCIALFAIVKVNAQEISFKASVDRNTIAVGEYISYTITLENTQQRYTTPDFGGLTVARGPVSGQQIVTINGRPSFTLMNTWTLMAKQPGSYTIGSSQVKVGGGVLKTEPIIITVTKAPTPPPNVGAAQARSKDKFVFASISFNKNKVYVGEQVIATYTLYSHYTNINLGSPEFSKMTGFWAEDVTMGNLDWEPSNQMVNGIEYKVAILKKQVLFPQKSGSLTIEPMKLNCVVNRSFFNPGNQIEFRSNSATLQVMELPKPAPSDFSGTVGDIQMNVTLDRTSVKANEAIQLNVNYSGRGNLKLLDAPKLDLPSDIEAYDPKTDDKISVSAGGMTGSKQYEYILIPRHEGEYDIPPITFSYYDTKSNSYRSLTSGPLHISVAEGEGGSSTIGGQRSKTDVTLLENDIRYIRTSTDNLRHKKDALFGSGAWYAGMAAPLLVFVGFLFWRKKHEAANADVIGTRRKHADRVAKKHLSEANKLMEQPEKAPFYTSLAKALNGYMADKFGIGLAQLDRERVSEKLSGSQNGSELANEYVSLITACDMARFAPVEDRSRQELYNDAAALIRKIEDASRT